MDSKRLNIVIALLVLICLIEIGTLAELMLKAAFNVSTPIVRWER
jgi:hypothetical protein